MTNQSDKGQTLCFHKKTKAGLHLCVNLNANVLFTEQSRAGATRRAGLGTCAAAKAHAVAGRWRSTRSVLATDARSQHVPKRVQGGWRARREGSAVLSAGALHHRHRRATFRRDAFTLY